MTPPPIVLRRLKEAGIFEAAIIDDVFEGPAYNDIRMRADEFAEDVADDAKATDEMWKRYGSGPDARPDLDLARRLYDEREMLSPELRKHVDRLLSDYLQRLDLVLQIEGHLKSLNLRVGRYGDFDNNASKLPPASSRLILLDYSLTPDQDRPRNEASQRCAQKLCERENRPFLVLVSDQPAADAHKHEFRALTEQVGGTFAFVPKQQARRADILYLHMGAWMRAFPAHAQLQGFVAAVERSIGEVTKGFKDTLRAFTVQDYSFIQRVTLQEEGQPLGEYMLEFLAGLLAHEFRAHPEIQRTREELDRLVFEQQVASDAQPSTELARMYRSALTDPVFGDVGPHPHAALAPAPQESEIAACAKEIWKSEGGLDGRADAHWFRALRQLTAPLPLLTLGDIFIRNAESELWMVVNAACDLMFSPLSAGRQGSREQPIYLMRGAFRELREATDTKGKEVTELFAFEGKPYRITWDYDFVRSVALERFADDVTAKGYRRVARLALPYALRIQRAWTAHLDRVGLPSPPPMFEEADISVYARNAENEWIKLRGPISGGAVIVRRKSSGGYDDLCVLTMDGEAAVFDSLEDAIRPLNERIEALEERMQTAVEKEREWLPRKIYRFRTELTKIANLQQDISWRLRLIENPIAIDTTGVTWIVDNVLAVQFQAGEQRTFIQQALLIVDVTRPPPR